MRLGIMQPYFLPYLGYFQLINAVDVFVVYDNIQYTKKGWINRNRYLKNGKDAIFSVSLKKDSDYLDVDGRMISEDFNKVKLLNQMREAYKKSPYFEQTFCHFETVLSNTENNLFEYLFFSLKETCKYLNIKTNIIKSSEINIDHGLKSQEKVLAICKSMGTHTYINTIGGQELYSKKIFEKNDILLKFIKSKPISYHQFENEFIPCLSIIDTLMFNSQENINEMLNQYELI